MSAQYGLLRIRVSILNMCALLVSKHMLLYSNLQYGLLLTHKLLVCVINHTVGSQTIPRTGIKRL